jgi:predicted DNA-binding transcriptional regulator AlpA
MTMPTTTDKRPALPDLSELPPWSSPQELAAWLAVPVASVYRWNQLRTGPRPTRCGKHVRYSRRAIAAWLEEQDAPRPPAT